MIRVNEDYVIEVDNYNYSAYQDTHKTRYDKKLEADVPVYKLVGHFGSLLGALQGIYKDMVRTSLSKRDHNLESAIKVIHSERAKFSDLLKSVLKEDVTIV